MNNSELNEARIKVTKDELQLALLSVIDQYEASDESPVEYELSFPETCDDTGKRTAIHNGALNVLVVINDDRYIFEVSE